MSGRVDKEANANRNRVVAVISSYQPTPKLVEHCAQLAPQVAKIIVVDDGSDSRASTMLEELTTAGVTVEKLAENIGIGAAMNAGFELARALSPEFVITLDQDSEVPDGFVDELVAEYDRLEKLGIRVGMVAPNYYSKSVQGRLAPDGEYMLAEAPIQSGLLIPFKAIDVLGPQRSDFFIDLVDTEYFCRALNAGFVAVAVPGLVLEHGFGHRLFVNVFGRRLTKQNGEPRMVAVSTPFRYYYRARNRVLLNRTYRDNPQLKSLLSKQTRSDIWLDFGVAVYSAHGKLSLLRLLFNGWIDGMKNRTGKIPEASWILAQKIHWNHPVTPNPEGVPNDSA